MKIAAWFQPTKEYVGLLPKETGIRAQAQVVSALSVAGFKILSQTTGPAAIITFKGSGSIPDNVRSMFEVVGPNQKFRVSPMVTGDVSISITDTLPWIGFDKVWKETDFQGAPDGKVGINDTGIDPQYADAYFKDRILERFTATGIYGSNHYHSRICLAVVGRSPNSEGKYRGACYAVKGYDGRSLGSQGEGTTQTVAEVDNWLLTKDVWVVNRSLGGPHDEVLDAITKRYWEAGIIAVSASGNDGVFPPPCNGRMNCPADAPFGVAVGATDGGKAPKPPEPQPPTEPPDHGPEEWYEAVMQWTARNPDALGRYQKWYVVCCGYAVLVGDGEPSASGTSLAAPHVVAVLIAIIHRLAIYQPSLTKQERAQKALDILFSTCVNLGYKGSPNYPTDPNLPDWQQPWFCLQGYGRPQADTAYAKAKEGEGPQPPSKIDKVEFYVDNALIGEATTGTKDVFQLDKVIEAGDHLFKGKSYSEGLDPVETEAIHFKVVKAMPQKKIVTKAVSPTDQQEFPEGSTIPFKVEAKVVEA